MNYSVIVLTAAALAAGSAAWAQGQAPGSQSPAGTEARPRPQMGRADMESLVDARIAAIQAGLKLTAEQQRLWPPVEQAIRGTAAERIARVEQRREARARRNEADATRPDFMARLERRSERVGQRAEAMKGLSAAMKPLWASLDERQKRLLPVLMRPLRGFGGRRMAWRDGRMGRHHGMMGRGRERRRERGSDSAPPRQQ